MNKHKRSDMDEIESGEWYEAMELLCIALGCIALGACFVIFW
jgi:hypothetical protein